MLFVEKNGIIKAEYRSGTGETSCKNMRGFLLAGQKEGFLKRRIFYGLLLAAVLIVPGCSREGGGTADAYVSSGMQAYSSPEKEETESFSEKGVLLSHCETVTQTNGTVTFSLNIPDGWRCEAMLSDGLRAASFGFHLYPEDAADGFVEIGWTESFGVCGTDLKEEEIELAEDSAHMGTYGGSECWSFISFCGKNSGMIAVSCGAEKWLPERTEQVLSILDSLSLLKEPESPSEAS